jgi:hypothetical protein
MSSPFWSPFPKSVPFYSSFCWSGARHPKLTYTKLQQKASDFFNDNFPYHKLNMHEGKTLLPIPFPRYFSKNLSFEGELDKKNPIEHLHNISSMSMLYSTQDTGNIIEKVLLKHLKSIPYKHRIQFEKEDYLEEGIPFITFRRFH